MKTDQPTTEQTPLYAAARIAVAAGMSKQSVYIGLAKVTSPGALQIDGREVSAWNLHQLPVDWQCAIAKRGILKGFKDGESYLASLPAPWALRVPWSNIPQKEQEKAVKLQKALREALALTTAPEKTAAEVEQLAMQGYRAEFGYVISSRHLRRLLHRTLYRDAGEQNWERVEIFLDERATTCASARPRLLAEWDHRALAEAFESIENRLNPNLQDRQFLWDAVFDHYEQLTDGMPDTFQGNRERRAVKASLVNYLGEAFPAGTLCASEDGLRKRFDEKLNQWREGGRSSAALADKRPERSGRSGGKLCDKCLNNLAGASVDLDGDERQAWRRLMREEGATGICPECRKLWKFDVRSQKSYLPKTVANQLRPIVETALPWRRGPKHSRLISPHVRRDWSDTAPGDWAVMDDATPDFNTYGRVELIDLPFAYERDSAGRIFVGRMEMLIESDTRTDYPRGFLLITGDPAQGDQPMRKASYNMIHQRLLVLHTHDRLGLPHKGWIQENGPWRNRLNDGERVNEWQSISYGLFSNGLEQATQRRIRRAIAGNPRTKLVERLIKSFWDRMRCHKGYVGNNERLDRREAVQDFLARVKAGKEDPGNELLEISEFKAIAEQELMAFAREPQNGVRLPGVSPEEAWLNGIDGHPGCRQRPLEKLGDSARWLLSSHETVRRVRQDGITLRIGRQPFSFWGPELEDYQNQEMILRFNLEEPEMLSCRPVKGGNPFTIRAMVQPATTATREELSESASARASWMRIGKVVYDNLPHPLVSTVARDSNQAELVHELGRQYVKDEGERKVEKAAQQKKHRRLSQASQEHGISRQVIAQNPSRAEQAAKLLSLASRLKNQEVEQ